MEGTFRRYPIGIQDFEQLRNNKYIYVDKTALIYQLVSTNTVYFLSRPRRFGKSLLISTLEAYFLGKKELFNGLDMEQLEKDWTVYPVLHIDFSAAVNIWKQSHFAHLSMFSCYFGKTSTDVRKAKTHLVYVWKVSSAALMSKPGSRLSY